MENISAPVSPNVVDAILIIQYKRTISGTLFLSILSNTHLAHNIRFQPFVIQYNF